MPTYSGEPFRGLALSKVRIVATPGNSHVAYVAFSNLGADPAGVDQGTWEGNPGQAFTIFFRWDTTGTGSAQQAPNTVTISMHTPGGAQIGGTWSPAFPAAGTAASTTFHFDDNPLDATLAALRSGMLEFYFTWGSTGGALPWSADSRGAAAGLLVTNEQVNARGKARSRLVLAAYNVSNVAVGGAIPGSFAYPDGIFVQDNLSADLYESIGMTDAHLQSSTTRRSETITSASLNRNSAWTAADGLQARILADFAAATVDGRLNLSSNTFGGGDEKYAWATSGHPAALATKATTADASTRSHVGALHGTTLPTTAAALFAGFGSSMQGNGTDLNDASTGINFGTGLAFTGGFTVDVQYKHTLNAQNIGIIAGITDEGSTVAENRRQWLLYWSNLGGAGATNTLKLAVWDSTNTQVAISSADSALVVGTSYKLAVDWPGSGGTLRLYINGAVVASAAVTGTALNQPAQDSEVWALREMRQLGTATPSPTWPYPSDGPIDELRLSKVARYAGAYTPATAPFTTDANTTLLAHCDTITRRSTPDASTDTFLAFLGGTTTPTVVASPYSGFGNAVSMGASDYLTAYPDGVMFDDNDFTVEWRIKPGVISGAGGLVGPSRWDGTATGSDYLLWLPSSGLAGRTGHAEIAVMDSTGTVIVCTGTTLLVAGTSYVIAADYKASTKKLRVYVNGTMETEVTLVNPKKTTNSTTAFTCGNVPDFSVARDPGVHEEIRVSAITRYNGVNYAPVPTSPFTTDTDTMRLYHLDAVTKGVFLSAAWAYTSDLQLDASGIYTADPSISMLAMTRTTAAAVVNFGSLTGNIDGTFQLQNARSEKLNATTHGTYATALVKSRDVVAAANQGTISSALPPSGAPPETYDFTPWTYPGPTSTASRGTGTSGDTAAHTTAGRTKTLYAEVGASAGVVSANRPNTFGSGTFVSLSDLLKLDVHPQRNSASLSRDSAPYTNPGDQEQTTFVISADTLQLFAFVGNVNATGLGSPNDGGIAGAVVKLGVFDDADALSVEGEVSRTTSSSGTNTGWGTVNFAVAPVAPSGNRRARARVDVDHTGSGGNYGDTSESASSGISVPGALLQQVGFSSAYTADRAWGITVPDEVAIGPTVRIYVDYQNYALARLALDADPEIKIFSVNPTTGAPDTTGGTATVTMTPHAVATALWYYDWTPSVAGVFEIKVRGLLAGGQISFSEPVMVRPQFDPIAFALSGDLVSRM